MSISVNDLNDALLFSANLTSDSNVPFRDFMSLPLREAREIFERGYLMGQVERFGGNISKVSAFIGMERSALHRKLRSLSIKETNDVTVPDLVEVSL
jgi:DNA-binding NtrC family response regulator